MSPETPPKRLSSYQPTMPSSEASSHSPTGTTTPDHSFTRSSSTEGLSADSSPHHSAPSTPLHTPTRRGATPTIVLPDAEEVENAAPLHRFHQEFPFYNHQNRSRVLSKRKLVSSFSLSKLGPRPPHPSTRLKEELPKPWLKYRDRAERHSRIIFWVFVFLGIAAGAAYCFFGYQSVPVLGNLCLVMEDDFSQGIREDLWSYEFRTDGFGNKEFQWTSSSSNNSFVQDGTLYIVPTLTADVIGADAVSNGYTLNLTSAGTCSSANVTDCVAQSNITTQSIINPIMSARMITRNKTSIRYGKVEVQARMPIGDWIWPAIWMLPQNNSYGEWPASGEIDTRGNGPTYPGRGYDYAHSALHWGPISAFDSWYKSWGFLRNKQKGYASDYNTFGMQWDERFITLYVNNRVYTVFDMDTTKQNTFWNVGGYPSFFVNSTGGTQALTNPWTAGGHNAPFDQEFYLILSVAVGGTNGWFPDNIGGKPWSDSSAYAMSDFWKAKDKWYPTWPQDPTRRGMAVKSVKMWQKC